MIDISNLLFRFNVLIGKPSALRALPPAGQFKLALKYTLKWEGGYVNHPNDKGGATNKGVTTATYNSYRQRKGLPIQSVQKITQAEVEEIYYDGYWKSAHCSDYELPLALALFDTAINFGVRRAIMILQRSLGVTQDGVMGPMSLAALAKQDQRLLAVKLCNVRIQRRYEIVAKNPSQRVFLQGWLNRDNDLKKYVQNLTK